MATPTITPNPTPEQFTEGPKQAETTNTRKTAKTNKPAPKPTAAPKLAPVNTKWQVAKTAKSKAEDPKSANEVVPPHPNQSLLEGISDLLDKLPLHMCVWSGLVGYSQLHPLFPLGGLTRRPS